jgi:hypothetical protein
LALAFSCLFNENVSWVATFHTFFPPPSSAPSFCWHLPTFIILQVPFLLYSSCIHEQSRKKKEGEQVMNDENPSVPTQKNTIEKEFVF